MDSLASRRPGWVGARTVQIFVTERTAADGKADSGKYGTVSGQSGGEPLSCRTLVNILHLLQRKSSFGAVDGGQSPLHLAILLSS